MTKTIKSDSEIYRMAKGEWLGILSQLWTAYGKPINKAQMELYIDKLGDVPLGVLEHAVNEVIKKHKFNSVPTLANVIDTLNKLYPYYQAYDLREIKPYKTPNRDLADRQRAKRCKESA